MSVQERVRYHEYMRPRFTNPTYASNNVGATMGLIFFPEGQGTMKSSPMGVTANINANNAPNPSYNYMSTEPKQQPTPRIEQPVAQYQTNKQFQNPQQKIQKQRSKSNLSAYGTKSLGILPPNTNNQVPGSHMPYQSPSLGQGQKKNIVNYRQINERDIYEKQQKKYNIITIQPREFNETIKKYPIYRLENIDQNYYKKLQLQDEYSRMYKNQQYNGMYMNNSKLQDMPPKLENKSSLNNYSKVNDYENDQRVPQYESNKNEDKASNKGFRPKMLNNIDQLGGVL